MYYPHQRYGCHLDGLENPHRFISSVNNKKEVPVKARVRGTKRGGGKQNRTVDSIHVVFLSV